MVNEIKYQTIWGKLYISLGFLFGILFVLGGLILEDATIYLNNIAAFIVIYIGYSMLKRPYANYDNTKIVIYGFLGGERRSYTFENSNEVKTKGNQLYLNGKRIQLNAWMVDKKDWQRLLAFFSNEDPLLDELKD